MPLTTGTCLGPYETLSALGAGGMGAVYCARDTKLNREVAIKSCWLPSRTIPIALRASVAKRRCSRR